MTMRDSIRTWRTGTSSLATSWRISSSFSAVSCTSRMLVRSSTVTLPRGERMEFSFFLRSAAMSAALA